MGEISKSGLTRGRGGAPPYSTGQSKGGEERDVENQAVLLLSVLYEG